MHRALAIAAVAMSLLAAPVAAKIQFSRLSEDQFIIHHKAMTVFASSAKALKQAYAEAAAVCVAAGFSHFGVNNEFSEGRHNGPFGAEKAGADLRVRFYLDPEEDIQDERELIECKPLAEEKDVAAAMKKLAKLE